MIERWFSWWLNPLLSVGLPSCRNLLPTSNQRWQCKLTHLQRLSHEKPPFIGKCEELPRWISRGYTIFFGGFPIQETTMGCVWQAFPTKRRKEPPRSSRWSEPVGSWAQRAKLQSQTVEVHGENLQSGTRWGPPVVSWFITPSKYIHIYIYS